MRLCHFIKKSGLAICNLPDSLCMCQDHDALGLCPCRDVVKEVYFNHNGLFYITTKNVIGALAICKIKDKKN